MSWTAAEMIWRHYSGRAPGTSWLERFFLNERDFLQQSLTEISYAVFKVIDWWSIKSCQSVQSSEVSWTELFTQFRELKKYTVCLCNNVRCGFCSVFINYCTICVFAGLKTHWVQHIMNMWGKRVKTRAILCFCRIFSLFGVIMLLFLNVTWSVRGIDANRYRVLMRFIVI